MVAGYQYQSQPPKQEINNQAIEVINKVFAELQAVYPAWKQAFPDAKSVELAKKVWIKTFAENGVTTIEHVKLGMAAARADTSDFIPSAGKFCSWCKPQVDFEESFYRFINRQPMTSEAERVTAAEVGYNCRREPADKAIKLWTKWLKINIKKEADGWLGKDKPKMIAKAPVRNAIDDVIDGYKKAHDGESREQMLESLRKKLKG